MTGRTLNHDMLQMQKCIIPAELYLINMLDNA